MSRGACKAQLHARSAVRSGAPLLARPCASVCRSAANAVSPTSRYSASSIFLPRCYTTGYSGPSPTRSAPQNGRPMTMGQMVRRIQQLRMEYPAHEVLDIILPDLPHCSGVPAPNIINVLLARDVYTVADLDYISQAVGVHPDAISWSTMINNALRQPDAIQAALSLYVEACRRGVRVQTSATNRLIGELANARKFYQPDPLSIRRAVAIFLQQISTEDKDDGSYVEASPLLHALVITTAIPNRDTHIDRILDWMKLRKLPIELEAPHLDPICAACLRCRSYSAAVSAVARSAGLSAADLKSLLGTIVRMRFEGETFMPLSAFAAFLRHYETCGHVVDGSVITTYLAGLRVAMHALCLPWETQAFGRAGRTLDDARRELRSHIYAFDAYIVDRYPAAADAPVYNALLYLLPALRLRDARLFDHLWGTIKDKHRPLSIYAVSSAFEAIWLDDQVAQVWTDYLGSGASPTVEAWAVYARRLLFFRRNEEAFSLITQHIGDDPEHALGAVSLFARASSPEALKRYAAALPRTWASPAVQRELLRYRTHRGRIGLAPIGFD